MILTTTWPSLGCTRLWPKKGPSLCRCHLKCFPWSSHRPHCEPSHCVFQRKDFPSYSFYVVVVVKTEDEACGGPLRYYPLRPDELFDAGNRTKVLDIVVSPAINCKSWFRPPRGSVCVCGLVQRHLLSLRSRGVCDGNAVLSGDLPFFLPAHFAGGLCGEQAVRHFDRYEPLITVKFFISAELHIVFSNTTSNTTFALSSQYLNVGVTVAYWSGWWSKECVFKQSPEFFHCLYS